MSIPSIEMNTGDLSPSIVATLQNADGSNFDLTNCTVVFQLSQMGQVLFSKAASIVNASAGVVQYNWQAGDTNHYGICQGLFIVTLSSGANQSFPVGNDFDVIFPQAPPPASVSGNYATASDVINYAQVQSGDFNLQGASDLIDFVNNVITQASAVIDDYCRVPRGFFAPGGMSFTEIIDVKYALHPGYYLAVPTYYPYPYILTAQLNNWPVLTITEIDVNQAGYGMADAWSNTPGETDGGAQFPANYSGWSPKCNVELLFGRIKFVNAVPARYYQGVKAQYTAGYLITPQSVNFVCLQLASSILQVMLQRKLSPVVRVGDWAVKFVIPDVFTLEHKRMLAQYQRSLMST